MTLLAVPTSDFVLPYKRIEIEQGSEAWKEMRFDFLTASQVPILMGCSPYQKPRALIMEKLTRTEASVDPYKQVLFDKGHAAEIKARQYVETDLGISLPPLVVVSNELPGLLASLDGFNESDRVILEAKYMGQKSLEEVKSGLVKQHHMIQVQAQLLATGAKHAVYFACTDTGDAAMLDIFPDAEIQNQIRVVSEGFLKSLALIENIIDAYTPPKKKRKS